MRVLGLVPYFSGTSTATHSAEDTRRQYLEACIDSLWKLCDEVIVGIVQEEPDTEDLSLSTRLVAETPPEYLPTAFLRMMKGEEGIGDYDLVYYTEADQVLHITKKVAQFPRNIRYLVPHRMEEVVQGVGRERGERFKFNHVEYVICNGKARPHHGGDFYKPLTKTEAFGGAWLASRNLYLGTDFKYFPVLPVEQASGFNIADAGTPWKTQDYRAFWVEHLSGKEYHQGIAEHRSHIGTLGSGLEDAQDKEAGPTEDVGVQVPEGAATLPAQVSEVR